MPALFPVADVVCLLAAVAIAHPLLLRAEPRYGLLTVSMLALVALDRLLHRRVPPWLLGGGAAALCMAAACWLGADAGLRGGRLLLVTAVPAALYALFGPTRDRVDLVVSLAFPLVAVATAALSGTDSFGAGLPGRRLLVWTLVAWPLIAPLANPRRWWWVPLLGGALLLVPLGEVSAAADPSWSELLAAGVRPWRHLHPAVAAVQVGIVVICVFPVLMEAPPRWRWGLLFSLCVFVGTLVMLVVTGPWPGGWPHLAYAWLGPAGLGIVASVLGMLGSVQRPDLMTAGAARAVALGVEATAVALLLIVPGHPSLPGQLVAAVLPVVLSYFLVLVALVAQRVAVRRSAPVLRTVSIREDERRLRFRLHGILDAARRGAERAARSDLYAWFSPQGLVPLLIFAACWPALTVLEDEQLIVWSILPALACSSLTARHLLPWCAVHLLLVGGVSWLVGVPPPLLPAFLAGFLVCAWPFVTNDHRAHFWAYPFGLLVLCPFWLLVTDRPGLPLVLAVCLAVLLINVLRRDRIRMVLLALTVGLSFVYLLVWTVRHDHYSPTFFVQEFEASTELGRMLLRLPAVVVLLAVLRVGRQHRREGRGRLRPLLFALVGGAIAVHWIAGFRATALQAAVIWVALIGLAPVILGQGRTDGEGGTAPVLDGLSLVLVVLVNGGADGYRIWLEQAAASVGEAGLQAGVLGEIVRRVAEDTLSIAAGLFLLQAGRAAYPWLLGRGPWIKRQWSLLVE